MPDFFDDVNNTDEADSSPAEDVNLDEDSSTSSDVNSDSSTDDKTATQEKAIPYSRFKEKVDEVNRYKAELESLKTSSLLSKKEETKDDWGFLKPSQQQGQQIDLATLNDKLRDDFLENPAATLANAFNYMISEREKKGRQLKQIPDFQEYENDFYEVPDEVVAQAAQNPDMIRFLLAKHHKTVKNRNGNNQPTNFQPQQPPPSTQSDPLSSLPPDVQAQILNKARQEVLSKMNLQSGLMGERTSAGKPSSKDEPELDEKSKILLMKMGIDMNDPKKVKSVTKRLQDYLKGR